MKVYNRKGKEFPEKLKKIDDCPEQLYVLGQLPDEKKKSVAIVGARECSYYGRKMAYQYAKTLAEEGVQIISGMARGIDSAAHEGAIAAGEKTFAVLGCGVDVCYPAGSRDLYEKIKGQGGIISEYQNGEKPLAWHFPLRNRIISGLSDLVLVIEARAKSGSLITADLALEQGKEVYALPGRVGDSLSEGCNHLISQGAGIAWNTEELLVALFHKNFQKKERVSSYNNKHSDLTDNNNHENMRSGKQCEREFFQKKYISGLAREEKKVYSCMSLQPKHVNEIIKITGLSLVQVLTTVFSLQTRGLVVETTKNYYAVDIDVTVQP